MFFGMVYWAVRFSKWLIIAELSKCRPAIIVVLFLTKLMLPLKIVFAMFISQMPLLPDEDYLNETFHPVYDCIWQDYHLQVFNQWGEKVFETFNPKEAWDAKYKHVNVTNDYYIWIANYTALENTIPTIFTQKGIVYVLR